MDATLTALREHTGVVVPVHVRSGMNPRACETALADNLRLLCAHLANPAAVCLSVDGADHGADLAAAMVERFGVSLTVADRAQGKLAAVRAGAAALLARPSWRYVALIDHDGDHFGNELLNFVRLAEAVRGQTGNARVLVLGQRRSRHLPMGLARGEFEELADRVLLDALAFRAAVSGRPLQLDYVVPAAEFPDIHSGFKLMDRATAEAVLCGAVARCGCGDVAVYRHAVEAVLTVEAVEHGAVLASVYRATLNEQPISAFGQFAQTEATADMIIWPCRRLGVPAPFVRQWIDNHIPRLLLNTLVPEGRADLRAIRRLVLAAFGDAEAAPSPCKPPFI